MSVKERKFLFLFFGLFFSGLILFYFRAVGMLTHYGGTVRTGYVITSNISADKIEELLMLEFEDINLPMVKYYDNISTKNFVNRSKFSRIRISFVKSKAKGRYSRIYIQQYSSWLFRDKEKLIVQGNQIKDIITQLEEEGEITILHSKNIVS